MLSNLVESTNIPILEQVIDFSQSRHKVLAGNIANIDTPGYRTRDLSTETFQKRLASALEVRNSGEHTSPGLEVGDYDEEMRKVKDSIKHILFHDGTDMSLEHQVAEISKNQFMHNMAITMLSGQYRMLQAAITERV